MAAVNPQGRDTGQGSAWPEPWPRKSPRLCYGGLFSERCLDLGHLSHKVPVSQIRPGLGSLSPAQPPSPFLAARTVHITSLAPS